MSATRGQNWRPLGIDVLEMHGRSFQEMPDRDVAPFMNLVNEWSREGSLDTKLSAFDSRSEPVEAVVEWLHRLPISGSITIIWPASRFALRTTYDVLIDHFSDLYYPMVEDLFVVDTALNALLVLDHEEIFEFHSLFHLVSPDWIAPV